MNNEKEPNVQEKGGKNRELTPDEILEEISDFKRIFCTEFRDETGGEVIIPQGIKIGDVDVSGKTLEDVLSMLKEPLEEYEPPIIQEEQEESSLEKEESDVPVWLKGRENLIWEGSYENPTWKINAEQYDDEVIVSYNRKSKRLRPGKGKEEQGRDLEVTKNSFTIDEWNVAKKIFDEYDQLENDLQSEDKETKKETRKVMLEVLKEESKHKKREKKRKEGKNIILKKVEAIADEMLEWEDEIEEGSLNSKAIAGKVRKLLSQLVVLNHSRSNGKEKVPKIKNDIKEIPSFQYSLEKLSKCVANQLNIVEKETPKAGGDFEANEKEWYKSYENTKGISLMVGEAGTGKNEAVEYFAGQTDRPFFWFPCGRGMEAIDMVAHYEFDSKEGTKRFLTNLAEGLQTPGAVVMIDEVNSLKPEVQAILHGLGDSNRSLNYDGVQIPVAEGVAIIMAGNPATYGSAGDLGQALISRTRGQSMVIEYPALKKGGLEQYKEQWSDSTLEQNEQEDNTLSDYACDEALILYPQLNEFSGLSDKEFSLLWDCVINENTQGSRITELENNPKLASLRSDSNKEYIDKILIDLRNILRIADEWRHHYEKRTGGLDMIGVSIRDTIAVVEAYKDKRDVRKAYLTVMNDYRKNLIDGLDATLKSLESLIEDVLGSEGN